LGKKFHPEPKNLASKLLRIRQHLDLNQMEILIKVSPWADVETRSVISNYERGIRNPPLITLLNYARLISVPVDDLIDDKIELTFKDN
jgi:transcriptional regulator with XRE-family HTH domain